MRRSRDRRGVFKHTPPPPSRWWKIQRPSRARVKMGAWNVLTFPKHSFGMLYQIFEFLLCAEAPPGPLFRGHVGKFRKKNIQIFGNCKNLIMCDGLDYWETCPEIWPKSVKKQQSYNISKHFGEKNGYCYFWHPEPQICGFFGFSKTDLVVHNERNRMAFTPSKSALRFSRFSGGGPNRPLPTPVNVLQKAHQ